jgi:hypothetical protein
MPFFVLPEKQESIESRELLKDQEQHDFCIFIKFKDQIAWLLMHQATGLQK